MVSTKRYLYKYYTSGMIEVVEHTVGCWLTMYSSVCKLVGGENVEAGTCTGMPFILCAWCCALSCVLRALVLWCFFFSAVIAPLFSVSPHHRQRRCHEITRCLLYPCIFANDIIQSCLSSCSATTFFVSSQGTKRGELHAHHVNYCINTSQVKPLLSVTVCEKESNG